ncbi:MAG TPA: hypothetical protein VG708_06535 [Mycobacteriales bacterium]|nr:hypothetical protein [Mycobacteriales bacterium]
MATQSAVTATVRAGGRAAIAARTLRRDRWWIEPAIYAFGLTAFVLDGLYAVFSQFFTGIDYYTGVGAAAGNTGTDYLSPFFSPCISSNCPSGAQMFHAAFGVPHVLSPGLIVLIFPMLFRTTCYYYRKAYYRSFWFSPPACAVAEPHRRYTGERRFPLILQNSHRYWWYFAVLFIGILGYDAVISFSFPATATRDSGLGLGVGSFVLVVNVLLLAGYTFGCHSCRSIIGGKLNHFSKHPIRYRYWKVVTWFNARHMQWAWASLIWVGLADLYVRLVATGIITDPHVVF